MAVSIPFGDLVTGLTAAVGLVVAGLCAWLCLFRWKELQARHADLAVPFLVVAAVFSLLLVSFPAYEHIIPQTGYSLLNLVLATVLLVPWAVFGLRYAGRDHLLTTPRILAGAVLVGTFTVAFVLSVTDQLSGSTVTTALLGLGLVSLLGVTFATAGVVLLTTYRHAGTPMGQSVALVLPVVALLMNSQALGTDPTTRKLVNLGVFSICAGSLWVAVTRYDALTRRPGTSRLGVRAAVAEMEESVVVVNSDGWVVSANATARELLGADVVGDAFEARFGRSVAELRDRTAFEHRTTVGYRQFDPRVSTVTGGGGQRLGATLTLIDVTERELQRQRIQVLNRVLRHNIRNELSAIKARADLATDDERDTAAEIGRIVTIADELEALSTDARRVERLVGQQERVTTDRELGEFVRSVVADVTTADGAAEVVVSVPSEAVALDWELFGYALRNVVENAIEHNDTPTPQVVVQGELTALGVRIVVADDGPGIPEREAAAIRRGSEDDLEHATSLGLWGTNWAVQALGGRLTIDESHLGGTAVTMDLPVGDSTRTGQR